MQGKIIDMDQLRQRNELTPAVGNARVNARGDEIGPGGKIIRKREEKLREYYETSKGVPDEPAVKRNPIKADNVAEEPVKKTTTRTTKKVEESVEDDWIEDDDGNFVKKGE